MKNSCATPPFVLFFPLAALDAILCGGGWIGALGGWPFHPTVDKIAEWHRREMLFGFVAAAMAGFLLTALPRWTGRPLARGSTSAVLACWLAARFAPLNPWPFALIAALPGLVLTLVASLHIWKARNARNAKTVLLLAVYASAGIASTSPFTPQTRALATNVAIVAIVSLIALIGGRVLPALAARFDDLCGETARAPRGKAIERLAGFSAAAGLLCWLIAPESAASAAALLAAGAAQLLRMVSWFGRRTAASPPLIALFAAYSSVPVGFCLLAFHALAPEIATQGAGLHVWTIGGFGGMILTIMSSMIRKRCGLAFTASPAAETAAVLCLAAAMARAGADFAGEPKPLLILAAICWSAAFALFLCAFRAPLLKALVRAR